MIHLTEVAWKNQENIKAKAGRPHEIGGLQEHLLLLLKLQEPCPKTLMPTLSQQLYYLLKYLKR